MFSVGLNELKADCHRKVWKQKRAKRQTSAGHILDSFINVLFNSNLTLIPTHTVRVNQMQCKAKAHDLRADTVWYDHQPQPSAHTV